MVAVVDEIETESPEEEFPHENSPDVDDAISAVQSCGVTAAGNAVHVALANGWTPQQIIETVEFFASMRPAWDGGALVNRLRCPGSHRQPIDGGWPPRSKLSEPAKVHTTEERSPHVTPDERAAQATNLEALHGRVSV